MSSDTATPERLGWVSSPEQRSTTEIIWNCLAIFLLCSWKCVHLNLPTPAESEATCYTVLGVPCWPRRLLARKWARQLGYMVVMCLAPEVVVTIALEDFLAARYALRLLRKERPKVAGEYTMAHAFCAQMGGVAIRKLNSPLEGKPREEVDYVVCSLDQLAASPDLPVITEEDVMDKSKADALVKAFALLQCGWLLIEVIARTAQGLAISELELSTTAFILCAAVIYLLWWDKPFGVERRIVITGTVTPLSEGVCKREGRVSLYGAKGPAFDMLAKDLGLPDEKAEPFIRLAVLSVAGAAFSAVHLAAWNWDFPSVVVRALWRASTMATFAAPFVVSILSGSALWFPRSREVSDALNTLFLSLYCVARLCTIVVTFYCFSSMPASVYETVDWVQLLPHFS